MKTYRVKILFVTHSLNLGGAEKLLVKFISNLDSSKYIPILVLLTDKGVLKRDLPDNVEIIELSQGFSLSSIRKLTAIIERKKPDIVFGFLGHVNVMLGILRYKFPKTKFVGRENAVHSVIFRKGLIRGNFLKLMYKIYIPKLDLVVSQSGYMTEDLTRILKVPIGKIIEIPNPYSIVHTDSQGEFNLRENFQIENTSTILTAIGRIDSVKQPLLMIEILKNLPSNYHLIFVGEGSMMDMVVCKCDEYKISDRVHFTGYFKETKTVMEQSDFLLLTSERESFPNVVIEATNSGLFTITHNMPGGIKDLIIENINGVVLNFNDIKQICNTIESFKKTPKISDPIYLLDQLNIPSIKDYVNKVIESIINMNDN